jgi:hypothetical protein
MDKSGNKAENFQKFVDQAQTASNKLAAIQTHNVERPYAINEGGEKLETNPILGEESTASQKSGSATDQEKKRQQQQGGDEVEEIGATGSKKGGSKTGSLMDELSKLNTDASKTANLGRKDIQTQTKDTIDQIEKVKKQLVEAKSEIKPSYQTLLNNRLTHVDDNLKIALSKAGLEHTPAPKQAAGTSPIHRFLGFLTHSQNQMEHLNSAIVELNSTNNLSPANLLAIQIKVGIIQQQIELFTSLLNKALEATKTIMNVQV